VVEGQGSFAAYAYRTLATLLPARSFDSEGKHMYLFWIVDKSEDRIPKFKDQGVRQEVMAAWKTVHARKPAEKQAEFLAGEARKAGKALKKVFAGRPGIHVTQTSPFSWLTTDNAMSLLSEPRFELSKVEGIDVPGKAFMRKVFDLQPGDIGVAFNQPQTMAYVIRPIEFTPSTPILMKDFETHSLSQDAAVAQDDMRERYQAWLNELHSSAGLAWERPADQRRDEQTPAGAPRPPEPDDEPMD
jgi:hypothetical protein